MTNSRTSQHNSTEDARSTHQTHTAQLSDSNKLYSLGNIYKFIATLVAGSQLTFHSTVYLHKTGYVIFPNIKTEIN